jgi:cytoskeletal protein RodZ
MRGARHLAALLIVLGALALMVPAFALAGGSAGNNQYTNPLGSTSPSSPPATSSTSSAPPATTPPATTPPATTPETTPATTPETTPASTAEDTTSSDVPTATAAAAPGTTETSGPSLPRTGYLDWEVAGFGAVLLAGGVVIRRRVRRA